MHAPVDNEQGNTFLSHSDIYGRVDACFKPAS